MDVQTASNPQSLTQDELKHIPILEIAGVEVAVKVGENTHPMEEGHFIEWIELYHNSKLLSRKNLKVGRKPEAHFRLRGEEGNIHAIANCNMHGAWKSEVIL